MTTLFPLSPPTSASDKLNSVLSELRQCVVKVSQPTNKTLTSKPVPQVPEGELERLQGIITMLKEEIGMTSYCYSMSVTLKLSLQLALRKNP